MSLFWFGISILCVMAAALLLFPLWRQSASQRGNSRNEMNRQFYASRLAEVQREAEMGLLLEPEQVVQELQHTLLQDINETSVTEHASTGRAWAIPGVLLLLVISVGFYLKSGGWQQVTEWRWVSEQLPRLRERLTQEQQHPLSSEEIARLGLALRTHLQDHPNEVSDWIILARAGLAQNDITTALQAFERAYRLLPDNSAIQYEYAETLLRSSDSEDNRQAMRLLHGLLEREPQNIQVLSLLAFHAYEQAQYAQAIDTWQQMLKLLPRQDSRSAVVRRSIERARQQLQEEKVQDSSGQ